MSTLLSDFSATDPFRAGPGSSPSAHSASEDSHALFDTAVAGHGAEYQLGSGRQVTPPFHPDDIVASGYDGYGDPPMSSAGARMSATPTIVPLSPPAESSYSPSAWSNAYTDPQSAYYRPTPRTPIDPALAANNARKRATYAAPSSQTQRTSTTPSPPALHAEHALHPAIAQYQTAHPRRALINFGPYILLQTLGEGEFGKVKLGVHQEYGEEVAVKLIRRGSVDNQVRLSKVEREIEVLKTVKHPNIVRLFDVIETEKYIGIILDFANGGELFDHILAHRYLKEKDASKLFAQLISGVSYLHQKHIVHRDLKLENLLLDKHRNVIITDFGFANRFEHKQDDLMATSCGSPCYAAPELVISEGLYVGSAVDIWSCGVILYAMLSGYLPFDDDPANPDGNNINLLYRYIVNTPLTFPDYISAEARDLLRKMLVPDPAHRCDLRTIMAHPWLRLYTNLFDRSVEELEAIAAEQQMHKRQASRRDMQARMRAQEQARIAQLARQVARASGQPILPVSGVAPPHQRHQSALPSVNTMPDYLYNAGQRRSSPVSAIPTSTTSTHLASPMPLQEPPRTAPSGSSGSYRLPDGQSQSDNGHHSDSALEPAEPVVSPRQRAESMQAPTTPKGKQSSRAQPLNDITPTQANVVRDRENLPPAPILVEERRERKDSSSPAPSSDSKRKSAASNKNRHTIQVEYDGEAAYEKILELQDQRNAAWARGERVQTEQSRDASPASVEATDNRRAGNDVPSEPAEGSSEILVGQSQQPDDVIMEDINANKQQPLPTPPASRIESVKQPTPRSADTSMQSPIPASPIEGKATIEPDETASRASSKVTTASRTSRASMPPPARPTEKQRVAPATTSQAASHNGASNVLTAEAQANLPAPPSAARSDRRRSRMSMDKLGLSKLLSNANVSTDSFTHFGRVSSRTSESKAEAKLQRAESLRAKEVERQRQKDAVKDKKTRRTTMSRVTDPFGNSPGKKAKLSTVPSPAAGTTGGAVNPNARPAPASAQGSVSGTSSRSGRPTSVVIQGDKILAPRPADRSPSNPSITTFEAFAAPSPPAEGHKPVASSNAAKKVMDWFRRKSIAKGPFPTPTPPVRAESRSSHAAAYPGGPGILVPTSASIRTEEALLSSSASELGHAEDVPEVVVTPALGAPIEVEEPAPIRAGPPPAINFGPVPPVDVVATKTSSPKRPVGAPQRAKTHRPGSLGGKLSIAQAPAPPTLVHDPRLRNHSGVVDQAALTGRPAAEVMLEVHAVLFAMGIEVKRESEFKLRCLRPRRKKAGATTGLGLSSVVSGGSLANITMLGNASASQTDRRGLPLPSSPSGLLSSPGGLRGMLRRGSSYAAGLSPDLGSSVSVSPNTAFAPGQVAPEPVYGEHTVDIGDEVRFSVELTKIKNLPGLLSLDMKRLRGNIWSFKYIYQTVLDRCDSLTH